ncbi:hypothetical protein, partial [Leptospira yasudae]|uniref:hypothetical protein n=1 Tax=Leptospira yasudae TaxID=2202201 RepID=UPI001AEFC2C4
ATKHVSKWNTPVLSTIFDPSFAKPKLWAMSPAIPFTKEPNVLVADLLGEVSPSLHTELYVFVI